MVSRAKKMSIQKIILVSTLKRKPWMRSKTGLMIVKPKPKFCCCWPNVLRMTNLTGQQVDNITTITIQFVVNCIALSSSVRGKPFSRFQVLTDLASSVTTHHCPLRAPLQTRWRPKFSVYYIVGSPPGSWVFEMAWRVRLWYENFSRSCVARMLPMLGRLGWYVTTPL